MSDSPPPQRGPVTNGSVHLSEWTLEQLAEGTLSGDERSRAMAHAEACGRWMSELDAYRGLFVALEGLPRFAPSPEFGDAVMARLATMKQPSVSLAWLERLERWLPSTTRGWMILAGALAVPALPMLALITWIIVDPLMSPTSLWQWGSLQAQETAGTALSWALAWGSGSGWFSRVEAAYAAVSSVPLGTLVLLIALLAVAIPLSAWSLIRLTRTPPMGDVTYAN